MIGAGKVLIIRIDMAEMVQRNRVKPVTPETSIHLSPPLVGSCLGFYYINFGVSCAQYLTLQSIAKGSD